MLLDYNYIGSPVVIRRKSFVETTAQIRRRFVDYADVTRVIPTCQSALGDMAGPNEDPTKPHILCLLESLRKSSWPMDRLRVLIADDKENGDSYFVRNWNFHCRRV